MALFQHPARITRRILASQIMMTTSCQASTRHVHTSAAQTAASELLKKVKGQKFVRKQLLDGNQLQKLSLILGRRSEFCTGEPPDGTYLPYGHHLVYFTPSQFESELGADGSDTTFNSPAPFTRRMWAGGEMLWNPQVQLRIGDRVEETTEILDAKAKKSRDGSEMVLVDVEKIFVSPRGVALTDRRSWIFRQPLPAPPTGSIAPVITIPTTKSHIQDDIDLKAGYTMRNLVWSPVALFQFSALTFNAHMIHFNESWTRQVEGHPNVVVHGPLNLINLMNYWRDIHSRGGAIKAKSIAYRALSPLYAEEEYTIGTEAVEEGNGETIRYRLVVKRGEVVCMRGEVVGVRPS
ncbi:uncharacterized protein QC761_116220 [Podospora bellae-mahoneyi]|uniref:Mesaconyl-C(4)-CoA hydratase n=1 Tax=Podospora bellae-mahoneyi TaxID=2093777 RepID=A0ABR0G071_9PEZI|nr:hypothetical protein QC761_116220 [Podospora bellae-mahoneyi]